LKDLHVGQSYDKEFKLLTAPHLKIQNPKEIVTPANGEKIIAEVDAHETPIADCYKVKLRSVFAEANKIPNLLHEIGRLKLHLEK
jgi:hypothetical protein